MTPEFKVVDLKGAGGFAIQDSMGNVFSPLVAYKTRKEAQARCDEWIAYYAEPINQDRWVADLKRLGWKKWGGTLTVWESPNKALYRGPYLAWCIATGTKFENPNAK